MRFLLDTHTLLWFLTNSPQLPHTVKSEISNKDNICYVSLVSHWELAIKYSLKKIQLGVSLEQTFLNTKNLNFSILPITQSDILACSTLPFHHRDPFDRLLIAQAQVENLTILTRDAAFASYDVTLKWN
jgi:PIN domain nuclease of toxin-antitoxin system